MRLIFLMLIFVVGFGLFLHTKTVIPFLQWVGHLPGDLLIVKNGVTIYLPLTTSLICSVALTLLLSKCSRKQ